MVECTHNDYRSLGTDINPMAVFISNTKIQCLALDTQYVKTLIDHSTVMADDAVAIKIS